MEVPAAWWKTACEVVRHPMACVSPNSYFIWVNLAFEQLVGYSRAELAEMTWMEITEQGDVGGDLASVKAVIDGVDDKYRISKRYRHKFGKAVPIELTVWRFPREAGQLMTCFIVEAVPETASITELEQLRQELQKEMQNLRNALGSDGMQNNQNADRGGTNNTNSTTVVVMLAVVLIVGVISLAAMFLGGTFKMQSDGNGSGSVSVEGSVD